MPKPPVKPLSRLSDWGRVIRLALALLFAAPGAAWAAAGDPPAENEVKAVFLYNFTKFVDWPPRAFARADTQFVVGVVGTDPFGPVLDHAFTGETVAGRKVTVRRFTRDDDLRSCHLLFIASSEKDRLSALLAQLARSPVLTVGDGEGFAEAGGVIQFVSVGEKVRFDINPAAAERGGLKISSKLLNLARARKTSSVTK